MCCVCSCAVLCRADCELSDISLLRPHTRRNSAPPSEQRFETVLEAANETEPVTVAVSKPENGAKTTETNIGGNSIVATDSADDTQHHAIQLHRSDCDGHAVSARRPGLSGLQL